MPSPRAIQDSDDEAEALSPVHSHEKAPVITDQSMNPKASPSVPAGTGSSTGPILFQKIYDEQHRAAMQELPQELSNSLPLPVLEDHIINTNMSFSPIPSASTWRLKRRRTTNASSLTSVTSPHEAAPRVKRAKSTRDMDDLTQITSPSEPARLPQGDIWDYTMASSDPKPAPLKLHRREKENGPKEKKTNGKLNRSKSIAYDRSSQSEASANNEAISKDVAPSNTPNMPLSGQDREQPVGSSVTKEKKTYGKLRRSKTMAPFRSSQSEIMEDERPTSKDDSHLSRKRRTSMSQDREVANAAPKTKRLKQALHDSHASLEKTTESMGTELDHDVPFETGSSSESVRIEVFRTASSVKTASSDKPFDLSFAEGSMITSPRMKIPSAERCLVAASAEQSKSTNSISVVPATFTESQKLPYESVGVSSTNSDYQSQDAKDVPGPELGTQRSTSEAVKDSGRNISSSPPVLSVTQNLKRAKTSTGIEVSSKELQAPDSSVEPIAATVLPKLKRSKTMASGRASQSSIDELAYTPKRLERAVPKKAPAKEPRKKVAKQSEERMSPDEPFGSDEVGLPKEQYQPRPSARRAKSVIVTSSAEDALERGAGLPPLPPPRRKKSVKAVKQSLEVIVDEALDLQSTVATKEQDEVTVDKDTAEINAHKATAETISHTDTDDEVVSTGSTTLVRPENGNRHGSNMVGSDSFQEDEILASKRRGRPPKSTEKVLGVAEKADSLSNEETFVEDVCKHVGIPRQKHQDDHRGKEANSPGLSKAADFLVPTSTPPAAEIKAAQPLVTPTKNIKKGQDHSPLPNSKVPYRVGLSKKTKIAPLLKMINK